MIIREARKEDLPRILELGKEFGHLMLYQKDPEIIEKCLSRILIAEEPEIIPGHEGHRVMVGYYHYIVSGNPGFEEMLRCYRQLPEYLIREAVETPQKGVPWNGPLCICMQGAAHREVFREFIKYLQSRFNHIWCYCSIKSRRPESYKDLGFTFSSKEQFIFFNIHKGDESTYQLGRWHR